VRRRRPRVRLTAIQEGGGQERGFRSGTLNVSGIVGLGKACELCAAEMDSEQERLLKLRQQIEQRITSELDTVQVNGHAEKRLPHLTNISFGFVEGESMMMAIKEIAVSSGSACTSASLEPSYVLKALGVGDDLAHSSLRISMGRYTTEAEVDYAIDKIIESVKKLRELSPLYDMHNEGIDITKIEWQAH
ncbi:MAG: aminotransferase class V-fold PLP-dependent enzyme, partial [Planctomycetota bacterium]